VYAENGVSVPARLVASVPATYPAEARRAEIEADVPVEIVLDEQGRVVAARAVKASGFGLDDAALRSIRGYRFSAALKDGHPVRVRMRWIVQFRLR
jgi:TonB family protein